MPYIPQSKRTEIQEFMLLGGTVPALRSGGELNYFITTLLVSYLHDNGERYQTYSDMLGALEGAKLELYRRQVGDYEDSKIRENGDVWTNVDDY